MDIQIRRWRYAEVKEKKKRSRGCSPTPEIELLKTNQESKSTACATYNSQLRVQSASQLNQKEQYAIAMSLSYSLK